MVIIFYVQHKIHKYHVTKNNTHCQKVDMISRIWDFQLILFCNLLTHLLQKSRNRWWRLKEKVKKENKTGKCLAIKSSHCHYILKNNSYPVLFMQPIKPVQTHRPPEFRYHSSHQNRSAPHVLDGFSSRDWIFCRARDLSQEWSSFAVKENHKIPKPNLFFKII